MGVGKNSIQCGGCSKWVHKKCSGVKGKLKEDPGYRCAKCARGGCAGGADEQERCLRIETVWSASIGLVTWVTCWEQQRALERRLGLESEGLGNSSRSC